MAESQIPSHEHGGRSSRQLSKKTWPDFDRLFAANGGVWGGCWCMFYHTRGEFHTAYAANRKAKHDLVNKGRAHGTIVYCGADPVGWCQFGPKEELPRIDTKRGYKPTSDNPWRITCLFVASRHRRLGVARFAVQESLLAMKKFGAKVVEAYPVEGESAARSLWMGTPHLFEAEGFSRIGPVGKKSWTYSKNLSKP